MLLPNSGQKFICKNVHLSVTSTQSPITAELKAGQVLKIPIAHADGRFFADDRTMAELRANDQILFKYCDETGALTDDANPNGSMDGIAGICNRERNVFGMMPHPERAAEPILGNADGRLMFESLLASVSAV